MCLASIRTRSKLSGMCRFLSFALLVTGLAVQVRAQAPGDAFTVQDLLQRYTESYGGLRDANQLSSVSMEGVQIQGEQEYVFHLHKKRPASMRYQMERGGTILTSVYNGRKGWLRIKQGSEESVEELSGPKLEMLKKEARFESPLFRHLEKPQNSVKLVSRELVERTEAFVIRVEEPGNVVSLFYMDPQTARILRIDHLDENDEVVFQTLYRDYKDVGGFPFAHEIENRMNGKTVSLTVLESVVVNPGLLSFYFENPGR